VLACSITVVATTVTSASAAAGSVELAPSASRVELGDPVALTGTLTSSDTCTGGRTILLEWRAADSTAYATVAQGTTGEDGTFAFTQVQQYTGGYRATALADGACETAVSDTVPVRVRARVDSTLLAGSLSAGACVDVTASVAPPKPGQGVELQQRTGGAWTTIETLTLDDASHASTRPCFGWEDVGIVRLRVRWRAQDPVNASSSGPVLAFQIEPARWMAKIEDLVEGRAISISVGDAGTFLYGHAPGAPRTPASNEKLLLSMAVLDTFGPDDRIRTRVATEATIASVLRGDLWILGHGDPELDREALAVLARGVADAGVERINGRVLGSTTYFRRDWSATGWNDRARDYVARPTALAFDGNLDARGRDLHDPEARAAQVLAEELEALGVAVRGRPGSGKAPGGLTEVASVRSRTIQALLARLLRPSDNFYAEVLGKRLGVAAEGTPGSIAKGAATLEAWVHEAGVAFELYDSSGLSYANRVTAQDIVRLLWVAETETWGRNLFEALPSGGQGTLRNRFATVRVRAKTGTLTDISALSGWVWLERTETWAEFSILSSGMSKATASDLEDRIVRILQNQAR
jgi:D-alanyl-D-alanine carboxypeptidase/D-alanyl-D-alanine-endopeptidase (penicillin-binding protein 4)